jgi:hypothetical protein
MNDVRRSLLHELYCEVLCCVLDKRVYSKSNSMLLKVLFQTRGNSYTQMFLQFLVRRSLLHDKDMATYSNSLLESKVV